MIHSFTITIYLYGTKRSNPFIFSHFDCTEAPFAPLIGYLRDSERADWGLLRDSSFRRRKRGSEREALPAAPPAGHSEDEPKFHGEIKSRNFLRLRPLYPIPRSWGPLSFPFYLV